jgi:hypothetical protein
MSHDAASPLNGITLGPAAKRKHMQGLGFDHDMLQVDRALNSAGLKRAFEVPGQGLPVLNDLQVVRARLAIVALGVEGPVARNDSASASEMRRERTASSCYISSRPLQNAGGTAR